MQRGRTMACLLRECRKLDEARVIRDVQTTMTEFAPFRLGGEADPNGWHFSRLGEEGPLPNPTGHTFPLLTHEVNGRWRLIGTGFYVNDRGFFVTARHVIDEVMRDGHQVMPLVILHFSSDTGLFGPSEFQLRPIRQCWLASAGDVALGVAAEATNRVTGQTLMNWTWTLSWRVPPAGTIASTFAFPNHAIADDGRRIRFSPNAYIGHIQASGEFRDRIMLPFPYLQVDFRIHGAASGGPIVSGSHVVGVNCTEWPENIDHPPGPGYGAQSRCLADAFLDDVVLPGEAVQRRVTFDELVRAGCINVEGYTPRTMEESVRGSLVRLDMPATAAPPAVEIEIQV
jgi:hypothetical protein